MSERKVPKLHLIGVKHKYIPKTFKVTIVRDPYDNCELSSEERKMVGKIACNPYFLTHIVSDDTDTFSFKIVPGGKGAPQIDYTLSSMFDNLPAYFIIRDVYIEKDFYSEEDEYFINMRSYTYTYNSTWYSAIKFAKDTIEPFSPKDMCFLDLLYQTNRIYETYSSEHIRSCNRINIFDDYIVKDLFYGCLNNIIGYRELADKDNTESDTILHLFFAPTYYYNISKTGDVLLNFDDSDPDNDYLFSTGWKGHSYEEGPLHLNTAAACDTVKIGEIRFNQFSEFLKDLPEMFIIRGLQRGSQLYTNDPDRIFFHGDGSTDTRIYRIKNIEKIDSSNILYLMWVQRNLSGNNMIKKEEILSHIFRNYTYTAEARLKNTYISLSDLTYNINIIGHISDSSSYKLCGLDVHPVSILIVQSNCAYLDTRVRQLNRILRNLSYRMCFKCHNDDVDAFKDYVIDFCINDKNAPGTIAIGDIKRNDLQLCQYFIIKNPVIEHMIEYNFGAELNTVRVTSTEAPRPIKVEDLDYMQDIHIAKFKFHNMHERDIIDDIYKYTSRLRQEDEKDNNPDLRLELGDIVNEFKTFAAEKDIPVISNTHFNNSDLKDAVALYNLLYEEYEEFAKFQTTKGDNMCNKSLKVITKRQMTIDHVKFSGDRTIIFWVNGDKTIVTMSDDVKTFNPEDAIAYGYMKRVLTLFGDNAHEKSMKEILDRWAVEEYNLNAKQHKKDLKRIKERKAKKKEKETE